MATFYGKQEGDPEVHQDFNLLSTRMMLLKGQEQDAEFLLLGDFNGKIGHPLGTPITRNGQLLMNFTMQNGLTTMNTSTKCEGIWTRVNPNTPSERSVIDYVLTTPQLANATQNMVIDEEGHFRLHSRSKTSDHNTITLTIKLGQLPKIPKDDTKYRWNLSDNTDWEAFQHQISAAPDVFDPNITYDVWSDIIIKAAQKTIGSKQVKPISNTLPMTKEVRTAKLAKKEAKKTLNKAYESDPNNVPQARMDYEAAKNSLVEEVYNADALRISGTLRKIANTGGVHSKTFWNLKRTTQANGEDLTCIKTQQHTYVHEPEEVKNHIANFYEELYKPSNDPKFDSEATLATEDLVNTLAGNTDYENLPLNQPITLEEVKNTIKSLPNNKSAGPNRLIYEFLTHGGEPVAKSLHTLLSSIFSSETPPTSWQDSTMVMLAKSNRKDGEMLENKRGLTLADCTCKVFERILLNRISQVLPYTEAQAGARKGRSTMDQSFTLKATLFQRTSDKKTNLLGLP